MASILLTTKVRLKTSGLITVGGTSYDDILDRLIEEVSSQVETYLGRTIKSDTYTQYINVFSPHQDRAQLDAYPVTSITTIERRSHVGVAWADAVVYTATEFDFIPETGEVLFTYPINVQGHRLMRITYVGGMAADQPSFTAAFPEVTAAVDRQIAWLFKRTSTGTPGATTISLQGANKVEDEVEMLSSVKRTLNQHRRVLV